MLLYFFHNWGMLKTNPAPFSAFLLNLLLWHFLILPLTFLTGRFAKIVRILVQILHIYHVEKCVHARRLFACFYWNKKCFEICSRAVLDFDILR
jgi:hypothetical protein